MRASPACITNRSRHCRPNPRCLRRCLSEKTGVPERFLRVDRRRSRLSRSPSRSPSRKPLWRRLPHVPRHLVANPRARRHSPSRASSRRPPPPRKSSGSPRERRLRPPSAAGRAVSCGPGPPSRGPRRPSPGSVIISAADRGPRRRTLRKLPLRPRRAARTGSRPPRTIPAPHCRRVVRARLFSEMPRNVPSHASRSRRHRLSARIRGRNHDRALVRFRLRPGRAQRWRRRRSAQPRRTRRNRKDRPRVHGSSLCPYGRLRHQPRLQAPCPVQQIAPRQIVRRADLGLLNRSATRRHRPSPKVRQRRRRRHLPRHRPKRLRRPRQRYLEPRPVPRQDLRCKSLLRPSRRARRNQGSRTAPAERQI